MRGNHRFLIGVGLLLLVCMATGLRAEQLILTLNAGGYRISDEAGGQRVEMEGFGYLMEPGKPLLPAKNFLVLLPPGAQVRSVEVKGISAQQLPGRYRIMPSPPIMPLTGPCSSLFEKLQDEWQRNRDMVYSSDGAYPKGRGKLKGWGTLRKYAYASISFYPFSYHPRSGRLISYRAAQVTINYSRPYPGGPEAERVVGLKWDTVADGRAARLFVNYGQMKGLYQPHGARPKGWGQTYDYVTITAGDLLSAIDSSNFLVWKGTLGYEVKVVLTNDSLITEQPGGDFAAKVRNFLRAYYGPWGIKYVLLVGDYATVPMRLCYPDSSEHSYNPEYPYDDGGAVPTDYYYADLSNPDSLSWDSDKDGYFGEYGQDSPDFIAEVYVGRIPTNDLSRITYALDKIVDFEQDTGVWKDNALHGGAILFYANEDSSGLDVVDGANCLDAIETDFMNDWTVSHYSEQEGLAPSLFEWNALSEDSFTSDWRNGQYGVINWAAHGAPTSIGRVIWSWDDGDSVPEHDLGELTWGSFLSTSSYLEDDYPSIVFAVSCNVGHPEGDGHLGIDLLTKPGFGSSAGVLSATRGAAVSVDWSVYHAGAEAMCYEFNHYMINGPSGPERIGEALYDSKSYVHYNFGWDHPYEYQNIFDYNLYGDPALTREGVPIGVGAENLAELPRSYNLMQNYPNPFNATTVIRYELSADGGPPTAVRLEIYNILGQKVATLVDRRQEPGTYSVSWKADNLGSGIYFYRLRAGGFSQTRKCVILK